MRSDRSMTLRYLLPLSLWIAAAVSGFGQSPFAASTPEPVAEGIYIMRLFDVEDGAVRIARDPHAPELELYYLLSNGDIYRFQGSIPPGPKRRVDSAINHGVNFATGMAFGPDGTLYLVGNLTNGAMTRGIIMRGVVADSVSGARKWSLVARSEFYPRSNTNYDHTFNGIAVSPDGSTLYVASGSRTDHGELQTNNGLFPGMREVPLTSAIFSIPATGDSLLLANDEADLTAHGYLFADGTRNTFDLAFSPDGDLFGAENSGDRDDPEELNWLRPGRHYGFPWRMGGNNTPQQFPGYNPAADSFVNKNSYGYTSGFYYDDSTYPAPPAGVTFTEPVDNFGRDACRFRDPAGDTIRSAGRELPLATFTPHRSPLGLVFDVPGQMMGQYRHGGFLTSWTDGRAGGSNLLEPFGEEGQDILFLSLRNRSTGYTLNTTRIARGFNQPIDMEIAGSTLYVLEYGTDHGIWQVDIIPSDGVDNAGTAAPVLERIIPNPCGAVATCRVCPPRTEHVRVSLCDMMGRSIRVLHDGIMEGAVAQTFLIDAAPLNSGPYVLRAQGATFDESRMVSIAH